MHEGKVERLANMLQQRYEDILRLKAHVILWVYKSIADFVDNISDINPTLHTLTNKENLSPFHTQAFACNSQDWRWVNCVISISYSHIQQFDLTALLLLRCSRLLIYWKTSLYQNEQKNLMKCVLRTSTKPSQNLSIKFTF